jgi:hypothetical protein
MGAADAILIHTIIQVTAAKVAEWRKEQTKQVTIMDNVAKKMGMVTQMTPQLN